MVTRIGTVIDEKYEILREIGRGGMSVVYLAMDIRLNKPWAVKEIKKTADDEKDEVIINSLLVEANLMKKLDHPALPRIVDIIDNGSTLYVVMDYIEGESLDEILKEFGPQPERVVLEWAMQLADALNYLHSQKPPIIYRDMKPANVMLKPEGNLKVIDFGIAREYKNHRSDTTVLGTHGYAPPEQYDGRTDIRSDIYALGKTMHHLLTGIDPGDAAVEYHPVRYYRPELSEGIEIIIDKCTEPAAENRYQNCAELLLDLEHPELITQDYRKRQKRKATVFGVFAGLAVLMAAVGISGRVLEFRENARNYENLVNDATENSGTPENRIANYQSAIAIDASNPKAYQKLLDEYCADHEFTKDESAAYQGILNAHLEKINKTKGESKKEYEDLIFETGLNYLYYYTEDAGKNAETSFRTRISKACGYFKMLTEPEQTGNMELDFSGYEHFNLCKSYVTVGSFYENYMDGTREPTKEVYGELLDSLGVCIEDVAVYEPGDVDMQELLPNIKLTIYAQCANLVHDYRGNFRTAGIKESELMALLDKLDGYVKSMTVTTIENQELQKQFLENCERYKTDIGITYGNADNSRTLSIDEK